MEYTENMKTTIDIPNEMLIELMKNTKAKTKRGAVLRAIEQYNYRQRSAKLTGILGTFEDFMDRRELSELRGQS